jgi:glycine cleavage system pyridoxal-binding protein P
MLYLPHTREDIASMLEAVGLDDIDDLFSRSPRIAALRPISICQSH